MNQHEAAVIQEVLSQPTPTQVTLKLFVTAQKFSSWETVSWNFYPKKPQNMIKKFEYKIWFMLFLVI